MDKKEVELLITEFIEFLRQKNITISGEKYSLPLSIFSKQLSITESIVKFLREEHNLSYKEIANLLYKRHGSVGVTYRNANRKSEKQFITKSDYYIPISIFNNNNTLFEALVKYLHDDLNIKFKEISERLGRNYRTIWTIYRRTKK